MRVAGRKLSEVPGVSTGLLVAACSSAYKQQGSFKAPSNTSAGAELAKNSRLRFWAGMMHTESSWGTSGGSRRVRTAILLQEEGKAWQVLVIFVLV